MALIEPIQSKQTLEKLLTLLQSARPVFFPSVVLSGLGKIHTYH
jgi:hypothetical protein